MIGVSFLNIGQFLGKMKDKVNIVVGSPITDIGKGWTTASLASLVESPLMIKIDPMLNQFQPNLASYNLDGKIVNSDLKTYQELGLEVSAENNLHGGKILNDFLLDSSNIKNKKLTFNDVSHYLGNKLRQLFENQEKETPFIEVGGIIGCPESKFISKGLKAFSKKIKRDYNLILLTYLERGSKVDSIYDLNTRFIVEGIERINSEYGKDPDLVLLRSRDIELDVTPKDIETGKEILSHKTLLDKHRFMYIPNFNSVKDLKEYFEKQSNFLRIKQFLYEE